MNSGESHTNARSHEGEERHPISQVISTAVFANESRCHMTLTLHEHAAIEFTLSTGQAIELMQQFLAALDAH